MELKVEIVQTLEEMAKLGALLGENPFKLRAFSNGARIIDGLEGDLEAAYRDGSLKKTKGIGKGLLEVIGLIVEGKGVTPLEEMRKKVPGELLQILALPGLGPKKVQLLWNELSITTIGELEYACHENRLKTLKGFGAKTQDKILEAIALVRANEGLFRLDQADEAAIWAEDALRDAGVEAELALVGEARRSPETVARVDLLARAELSDAIADALDANLEDVRCIEARHPSGVPVFIHFCADQRKWGARVATLSASEGHLKKLKSVAEKKGMEITESGLKKGSRFVDTPDEARFYDALGLAAPSSAFREEAHPLIKKGKALPILVQREDLRGALHNHTTASDGRNSLEEMRKAARERQLEYLGISDHSQTAVYAHGLEPPRLVSQAKEIATLNKTAKPGDPLLLTGVESDILSDGSLDYPEKTLKKLQVVVASVHNRLTQSAEEMNQRVQAAVRNPYTDIIGHPTGRLLLARKPSSLDVEAMLDVCAEVGCAAELNANPHRLDLSEAHLVMAKDRGVLISIAADAHSQHGLDDLDYGVRLARRAGLTPENVLNCLGAEQLLDWLSARRKSAGL
jgi:DNA polymerase (family 10)